MYAFSSFTDPVEHLLACPSFPQFGASTGTITNFLVIEPSSNTPIVSYSISIEYLPFLDGKDSLFILLTKPWVSSSFLLFTSFTFIRGREGHSDNP